MKGSGKYAEGMGVADACDVFHVQHEDLMTLIEQAELKQIAYGRYDIYELASLVVRPRWTDEQWETVMSRRFFPPKITKEFWAARQAKQNYLLAAGDLWPTAEVVATLGEVLKTVAMGVKLTTDNIERETGLTAHQRDLINNIIDEALRSAAKQLRDKFEERVLPEKLERFQQLTGEKVLLDGNSGKEKANASSNASVSENSRLESEPAAVTTYDIADL